MIPMFDTVLAFDMYTEPWFVPVSVRPKRYSPYYCGITSMNLELIGQLVSVSLVVGAGPIIVAAVYARGGNL